MKKAEITVFLSLVFVLIVSFVLGILQISVIHTSKNLSRLTTDRAVFSVFGEYQTRLLEDYYIFAIDGSYGSGEFSQDKILGRMYYYGGDGTKHEITGIQFLTDNGGQSFREQALEDMEETYGIGLVHDLTGLTADWETQEIQAEEIGKKEETILADLENLKESAESLSEETVEKPGGEGEDIEGSPFTCIEQIEKAGILSVVMPKDMELSEKSIPLDSQVSKRELLTGSGSFPMRQGMNGISERLLFDEYILNSFTNAADTEEKNRSLSYEVEYILSGKASDKDNLEAVLMKIFLIRMALNYAYLLGDSGKKAEAEALAFALSVILLIPEGTEILKQLILLAWAAGESVADIRTLLLGGRVPLIKTAENWRISLPELLVLGDGSEQLQGADTQGGISYKEYLRALLFLTNQNETVMRSLDRIEENLVSEHGLNFFRADQCVTKIEMKNIAGIFGGMEYTYPVYFGYE